MTTSSTSPSDYKIIFWVVGIALICFAVVHMRFGFSEEGVRQNIRLTARFSLICFCLAFVASSLHSFFENSISSFLLNSRKSLGVSFAVLHLVHLFFLILLHQNFQQIFVIRPVYELVLGGLAYMFVVLMLLTSFEFFSKRISHTSWQWLHKLGGYWILIVFSNSIISRVVFGQFQYLPLAVLIVGVWVIRFLGWRTKRVIPAS